MYVKKEHSLPFEKWIFRNGQQVRNEDRSNVAMFGFVVKTVAT